MSDPLAATFRIASSGLEAQSTRLRVVAENIANAESTASTPGGDPYRRKLASFESTLDRTLEARLLKLKRISDDERPFRIQHDPSHPAADDKGFVKLPNVDMLVELADMKEANRSYQASLQIYRQARELHAMTLDLLKA
ncbi:MAG: flagellar basal body rod protein FlgC [Methylobacteriaceae bacterium]|nr:flagellar basal body rod protein FlgC [Methylobacteriaceae bacterium]